MNIITIDKNNIDAEHICCAIGNDKANKNRAASKKEWMKARFDEGLVFKRLDDRGKIFIEYMPIEKVWKPIIGKNYFVINCLWVSGKFKGQGISNILLNECIKDAESQNKDGIAVVSSDKVRPFLTDKKFFLKKGFEVVDKAKPYFELLTLKLNDKAENPQFTQIAKSGSCPEAQGFLFEYSNQCPFMEEYVQMLFALCKLKGIPTEIRKLVTYQQAQNSYSPFGTLGIYSNGQFLTHELMTPEKFEKFLS